MGEEPSRCLNMLLKHRITTSYMSNDPEIKSLKKILTR